MKVVKSIADLHRELDAFSSGHIGLVPTMGCLHRGHMSLVEAAGKENDATVVSIFVNPTQFGPGEDLERYPRDLDRDCRMLREAGVELVFAPAPEEMYPPGFYTRIDQEVLGAGLCGASRPGHFSGVLTVVAKLLGICRPDRVYFGIKDAQQAVMVTRMVRDLNMHVKVRVMPIIRDADGLALSSRNRYLSHDDRLLALALPGALDAARRKIEMGEKSSRVLVREIRDHIVQTPGVELEYVEIVNLDDMQPIDRVTSTGTLVAAAIRVGGTRLIDNFIVGEI